MKQRDGVALIAAERTRQQRAEGWTAEHDDGHDCGELAMVAACYATPDLIYVEERYVQSIGFIDPWPWDQTFDARPYDGNVLKPNHTLSPTRRLRQLVKAGALIAAEIDRLLREQQRAPIRTSGKRASGSTPQE